MKSTFSTIFYLKRQTVKADGTSPIMGRITIDGTQMISKALQNGENVMATVKSALSLGND